MRSRSVRALAVCASLLAVLFGRFDTVTAVSSNLVISQVYGGGGNSGAQLRSDFIEIFNRGSAPVSLAGMSVQYASASGTTWQVTPLTGVTLAPGQYYLVQQATGTGGTVNLPVPDVTGTITMGATAGKVALVDSTAPLSGACPAGVVDLVGFGSANCFEGSGATPALSNTTAAIRGATGCSETDNNAADFSVGAPNPRNTATPAAPCGTGDAAPAFSTSSPANAATNVQVNSVITVTFTESVSATGSAFSLTCGGAPQAFTQSSSPNTTLSLTPATALPYSSTCAVAVSATQIADADGDDPPDQMSADAGFSFTTEAAPGNSDSVVVISQLYGGGGNSGAVLRNDFIELYNRGTATVDVTGWSVQYASATSTGVWSGVQPLAGTIGPGQYYLVALASGGGAGAPLPAANVEGDINMSGTTGKVALVQNSTPLSGCPVLSVHVEDLVGYGTANCREGALNAAAPSNTTALFRLANGVTDTDRNSADFTTGIPAPRRTAPFVEVGPSVASTFPVTNSTIAPRDATIEVTFSEPVDVVGPWFDITCATSGAHNDATFASNGDTRAITPNSNFIAGEQCTVTVFKNQVHDRDIDDGPDTDTLSENYGWSFTVATGTEPPFPSSVHLAMGNPSGTSADQGQPDNFLMEKPEFALSYNRSRGGPNWVSWHLSNDWVGSLQRDDTFRADPAVPPDWYRVQGFDFSGSGFDRGHMVPNADRDKETARPINQATFLMSNILAQAPDNNQGPWADMENDLRDLLAGNELYIVAGGFGMGGTGSNGPAMTIANGEVTVPAYTWKVALVLPEGGGDDASRVTCSTRTIAVIMPNVQGIRTTPWQTFLVTVDDVEALTGYNFFSNLPEPYQQCVEAGINGVNPDLVKGAQTIAFAPIADRGYDASPFTVSATGGPSGNPVTFAASGSCTSSGANGATITLEAPGACTVTASQAGSVIYEAAPEVSRTFTVRDAIAPVISPVTATPDRLGPPNHKMIDVALTYTATDFSGTPVCALSVSSNEPANGTGDGNTSTDWQVVDQYRVRLRAERAGGGTGRTYTVTILCTDASGNESTAMVLVSVAK